MKKNEEPFYRWMGWILSVATVILIITDYAGSVVPIGCAITGVACSVLARLIRLERRTQAMFEAIPKKLEEVLKERLDALAVRDEKIP